MQQALRDCIACSAVTVLVTPVLHQCYFACEYACTMYAVTVCKLGLAMIVLILARAVILHAHTHTPARACASKYSLEQSSAICVVALAQ